MPVINIETTKAINPSIKKEMLRVIHEGAINVLKIPADACHLRWIAINEDDFFSGIDLPDNHIFIEIKLFPGRSLEIKKSLYQFLFNTIQNYGIETKNLMVALNEIPKENWGMNGGRACSELSFNYDVHI